MVSQVTDAMHACNHHWHEEGSVLDYPIKTQYRILNVENGCERTRHYLVEASDPYFRHFVCCHCNVTRHDLHDYICWSKMYQESKYPVLQKGATFLEDGWPKGLKSIEIDFQRYSLWEYVRKHFAEGHGQVTSMYDLKEFPMELRRLSGYCGPTHWRGMMQL